ncbi:ferrous iron transporter B [candidate division TA06 bacterium]|uniref:Ferrous iron transporter B n=1 Tax=candidate division TA06 bacterium TaxID=2250710 RepID=A0A933MIK4_UNCT6|nr:ferrous iron transporter B [candidate division TA06 bacterium]
MKRIVLMGNPNVGKSVVFSRLTGAEVIASNYPGTTVDFSKGRMHVGNETVEISDAPGTYSLQAANRAEEVAGKLLDQADLLINVVDATNLERSLFLTLELMESGKPIAMALNIWDEARHLGINIDTRLLEQLLGIPVIPTVAITGEGVKELVARLNDVPSPKVATTTTDESKWTEIGRIINKVQHITHRHHTLRDRISDATVKPGSGLPIAFGNIFLCFWAVRIIGENLIGYVFEPLFELYRPLAMKLSAWLGGSGFFHHVLIGKLIDGEIDYGQSMGILTTGLFVPIGMVLPYIAAFYLILAVLEDSGYLPRLSTLTDNIFHKLGMHGHGIVPVFLGLGCNVPGALSSRIMETRKQRFISATLMAIAVPCMAQIAMIFGILGPYGPGYLTLVFAVLTSIYITVGLILNRYVKGESPEIFLELPPYRRPSGITIIKKTWMRVRWFLLEAVPQLLLGVLAVNVLYAMGFLEWLGSLLAPITVWWLGLPKEAAIALLTGFFRKDLAVGMLLPLRMSPQQLTIAVIMLAIYFPCVATFAVMTKELGAKDMLKATAIMMSTALIVGGLMRLILIGFK